MEKVKGMDKFLTNWNELIEHLIELELVWSRLGRLQEKYELDLACFSEEGQAVLSKVNLRSKFVFGIPDFITFIATSSTFANYLIDQPKKKEVMEDERRE